MCLHVCCVRCAFPPAVLLSCLSAPHAGVERFHAVARSCCGPAALGLVHILTPVANDIDRSLLCLCRDAASQPGVSGDGHAEVVGAMMSALNGLQQQPAQQQQQVQQQQDGGAQWTQQQLQPFGHGAADSFVSEPPRSLQQQALARDTTTMLADWHTKQAAAGRGFERQRSGSAPLPIGAGRWWQDGLRTDWAPRPSPLHCSGGILDSSLGGHWQPQQQQQALAPGAVTEPGLNFIADFASMPSVPLLAHTDPLWDALQQQEGSVTVEAPPQQQQQPYSQPPMQQPAASCQLEGVPGPISTTGWATAPPSLDAYDWAQPDHIVPQQPPRPIYSAGNGWAPGGMEASGAAPPYPSTLPASLAPPGANAFTGGSCSDLAMLQDAAAAPWTQQPIEVCLLRRVTYLVVSRAHGSTLDQWLPETACR